MSDKRRAMVVYLQRMMDGKMSECGGMAAGLLKGGNKERSDAYARVQTDYHVISMMLTALIMEYDSGIHAQHGVPKSIQNIIQAGVIAYANRGKKS